MDFEKLKRPAQGLTWSLVVLVLSFATILMLPNKLPPVSKTFGSVVMDALSLLVIVAFFASLISYYIFLGTLAKRLGRRWLVWCGLTIASSPIGFFVSYFWIRSLAEDAVARVNEQTTLSPAAEDAIPNKTPFRH